ncbi:MAG: MarR family winged helix-turn-helix transcriptional regulator [Clostridiales bacterium]|nr:MarR family winged helix-turn-helix transcriptional regulator [Clostridiales bacterium]MCD8367079.1 MarR family winged helix-turn-helix transcriptional regulator [Clostridiales bacterium]
MEQELYQQAEEFFLNRLDTDKVFKTIDRADYAFLYSIARCQAASQPANRAYLYQLSEMMDSPIPRISKAIRHLQDEGYVTWKTDDEMGRTYVTLTNIAVELMQDMKNNLQDYYKEILETVDGKDLETTLRTMKQISDIISAKQAQQEDD